jgi:hypothetical protein
MPVPDFSPGEVLTAAAMDSIGLWLVKTQTVGTGVSSVVVSSAFSTNYDSYRIIIRGVDCSAVDNAYFLTLSGSTGSTYSSILNWLDYAAGSLSGTRLNSSNSGFLVALSGAENETNAVIDIHNPFRTLRTTMTAQSANSFYNTFSGGRDANTASSTGFTIVAPAGQSFTGGTINVYGYRN